VRSAELLRKLAKLAKQRRVVFRIAPAKGSHHKIYFGTYSSVIPYHNAELKTGTLKGILKDLHLKEQEL
jgi:predicted RNA binding protein YcfA (HicA-like mRNA interferase family)